MSGKRFSLFLGRLGLSAALLLLLGLPAAAKNKDEGKDRDKPHDMIVQGVEAIFAEPLPTDCTRPCALVYIKNPEKGNLSLSLFTPGGEAANPDQTGVEIPLKILAWYPDLEPAVAVAELPDGIEETPGTFRLRVTIDKKEHDEEASLSADTQFQLGSGGAGPGVSADRKGTEQADFSATISAEEFFRMAADHQLDQKIQSEQQSRQQEDARLDGRIDQEAAQRQSGDTTLALQLNQESNARQQADDALRADLTRVDTQLGDSWTDGNQQVVTTEQVGIGSSEAPRAALDIRADIPGPDTDVTGTALPYKPEHHVVIIENTRSTSDNNDTTRHNTGGLAVVLNSRGPNLNAHPLNAINTDDNFVTFFRRDRDGTHIAGRIEGVSVTDVGNVLTNAVSLALVLNPFDLLQVDFELNPIGDWLDIDLPSLSFSGGGLPSATFSRGSLPSATFHRGSLPSINFSKLSFSKGSLPSLSFGRGSLPSLSFNPGTLPEAHFDPGRINQISSPFKKLGLSLNESAVDNMVARVQDKFGSTVALGWQAFSNRVGFLIKYGATGFGAGVTYESGAGDYAEWLPRRYPGERLTVGDIVGVYGGQISKKTVGADHVLAISYKPIVLGNMPPRQDRQRYQKVAFMGQTQVKVRGAVHKGDFILPSGREDGTGIAVSPREITLEQFPRVLGVAWGEQAASRAIGLVNVAVGLRAGEVAGVIERQQARLTSLEKTLEKSRRLLASLVEERDSARRAGHTLLNRLTALERRVGRLLQDEGRERLAVSFDPAAAGGGRR